MERWIARLFVAMALVQLVPVWAPRYYPTQDGPAHVYNAWVMREIVLRHDNLVTHTYEINAKPYPNLLDHVLLAVLLGPFHAPVAEKVFVSAIILLFLGGAWMFAGAADPRASLFAFLAVPLSHHLLLKSGFYNFSLSVGLYFVVVAVWWTRRDRPDRQTIALVALLLVLCYFAHPLSTLLAIGSIGLLWLATSRDWRHLIAFIPVLPLLAWFMLSERGPTYPTNWSAWNHLTFLAQTQTIATYGYDQFRLGKALFVVTVLLMAITIAVERRRRAADAFLLVLAAVFAAFELGPAATSGGSMVLERLGLFVSLLPLPWLSPRLGKFGRAAFAIVLSVAAVAHSVYLTQNDRRISSETTALVRAARTIPKNHAFFPVVVDRQPPGTYLGLMWHAGEYAAIERRLVDLNNYEPRAGYFPVRYRDTERMFGVESIANNATDFPADRMAEFAEYVFTWNMPYDAPVLPHLDEHYKLIAISNETRIYRRKLLNAEEVLLPLAGTASDAGGPSGERWGVEQMLRNRGTTPVDVDLSPCCAWTLAPAETKRVATSEPYLIARIAPPANVEIRTTVHRVDRDGTTSRLEIPSIPFRAFRSGSLDFGGLATGERILLRVWILGSAPAVVTITENGVARQTTTDNRGYLAVRSAARSTQMRVDADARLWGFITTTDAPGAGTIHLPR